MPDPERTPRPDPSRSVEKPQPGRFGTLAEPAALPHPSNTLAEANPAHGETLSESGRDPAPSVTDAFGSVHVQPIPGYRIEGVLGKGGMGIVFKAWDTRVNRPVALKMIRGAGCSDTTSRVRFQIEAEVVAQFQHPNIVQLYEFGIHDGQPYGALEFIAGGSLADRIQRTGIPTARESAALVAKLADAIAAAHAKGIIHRDLKPHNVLLTDDGEPKVTDFGLARIGDSDMTATGVVMGTPSYMSPEQAAGRTRDVGTPADVYSLGVILYELLTGRRPFEGPVEKVVLSHVLDEPRPPRAFVRNLPRDLQTICLKCLSKDPKKRYSARALAVDLQSFLEGRPIAARPVGPGERSLKWVRRNPWRAVAVATCAVVAIAATAAFAANQRQRRAELRAAEAAEVQNRRISQAERLVQALAVADTVAVPRLARELEPVWELAEPSLRDLAGQPISARAGLHSRLALLHSDPRRAHELAAYIPDCRSEEILPIREMLAPHSREVSEPLWVVAVRPAGIPARRLRAACFLASLAPHDPRWIEIAPAIVEYVVRENALEAVVWAQSLDPVHHALLPVMVQQYLKLRDRVRLRRLEEEAPVGEAAAFDLTASLLARYAASRPNDLAELAMTVQARHYSLFDPAIVAQRDAVSRALRTAHHTLAKQDWLNVTPETPFGWADAGAVGPAVALAAAVPEAALDAVARRRAYATAALLKLGDDGEAWPLLRASPDPSTRVHLMHRLAGIGVDPLVLIRRFRIETDPTIRRSLLLAVGEYPVEQIPEAVRAALVADLLRLYRDDRHPGLHSAIDWFLRQRWSGKGELDRIDAEYAGAEPGPRNWFVNREGQTFAVVRGPVEFVMGTPATEVGRVALDETPHRRKIPRSFAVQTKEVTHEEFKRFRPKHRWARTYNPEPGGPAVSIDWDDAAAYCNWLSERDDIPRDQWCYEPDSKGVYGVGMKIRPGHLSLAGYRIPTEAEWEYTCRAGTRTSRPYGSSLDLLHHYGWYFRNAENKAQPVGRLKPNDLGTFDMLGNLLEWVEDPVDEADRVREVDDEFPDHAEYRGSGDRHPRGGAYNYPPEFLRSAACIHDPTEYRIATVGFRVARTLPLAP